jgi:hypothetical protein
MVRSQPLIEDTRAFQLRRLEYHFDRLCAVGVPLSSKLTRAAHLKSDWRDIAEAMIHRASARDQR